MFLLASIVLLVAIWLFVFWVQPLAAVALYEELTPNVVYRVPVEKPLVALSFDDGPHPRFTPRVLDILQRHGASATFFLIGERAVHHPELVARIKAAGHQVCNHYYKNGPTFGDSDAEFLRLLHQTENAIGPIPEPKLFRARGESHGPSNCGWLERKATPMFWARPIRMIRHIPRRGTSLGWSPRTLRREPSSFCTMG